jgi:hypothetical protein
VTVRPRARRIVDVALLVVAGLLVMGCTSVTIKAASQDDVELKTYLGLVSIELKPGAGGVIVESTSVGVMNAFDGLVVGYRGLSLAALPPDRCQLVLWIRTDEELKELSSLLREHTDVCVVRPGTDWRGKP